MKPDHWTEHTITVPSPRGPFTVHYTRTGEGSGKPPLVLAHGFADNGLCWLPVARALEADWDVILPDARGHGLSQRFSPPEEVHMADDLADFIRAMGLNRPVVGGHSMGGTTAAVMDMRHPGLARALILEDPGLRGTPPKNPEDRTPHPFKNWVLRMQGQTVEQIIEAERKNNPNWPAEEWPAWAESKRQVDPAIFDLSVYMVWPDWREVVRGISAPTLVVTADVEKGGIISPEIAQEFVRLNPGVRVVHIPGSGHSIRRDRPAEYLRAIQDFLHEVQ